MKILLIAGTGAIGSALMKTLCEQEHEVFITSRACRKSDVPGIKFIQGNAWDDLFITLLLSNNDFDIIVDFGNYDYEKFLRRKDKYLYSTNMYIFLSTAHVYAENGANLLL